MRKQSVEQLVDDISQFSNEDKTRQKIHSAYTDEQQLHRALTEKRSEVKRSVSI